ncbi:MAG: hydrogenase maturation protease [candidate division WOR-3 bacterium]|nr:MAG: hydrogenase maturation protease [candidate division WOR-3 bacterium]
MQNILIYGVGNPYRCDDAVGLRVVHYLKDTIKNSHITIKSGSIDGLTMLDEILGYDRVIFIDSIKTENGSPGDIYKIKLDPLENTSSLSVSHGIDFVTALRLGKQFGYTMPKSIEIYAIEIEDNTSFGEECTEKVKASIPEVVDKIMEDISK